MGDTYVIANQVIASNYYNYYKAFAQSGIVYYHEGSVSWIIPYKGNKGPSLAFRIHLNEENAETELKALIQSIRKGEVPQRWIVTPDATPGNIIDIMERNGFIFQQYYLLANMNVQKNVKMDADLAANRDYKEIIEAVGLKEKVEKYPHELSGGEQQRVSVARALAKKPRFMYLDEPTGALDEQAGRQVLDYICKLQKQYSFTIVMVTHNLNIAEMAQTVIRMNSGKITTWISSR